MAREADELRRELEREPQGPIGGIEAGELPLAAPDRPLAPAPDHAGEALGRIGREAQGLADLADRTPRAVADHRRREPRALAAPFPVDVLDHLLAPLVL